MRSPRITNVEALHHSAILLYFSDGSVIEVVPVQTSGNAADLDTQQTVLVAIRDPLRRAGARGASEP